MIAPVPYIYCVFISYAFNFRFYTFFNLDIFSLSIFVSKNKNSLKTDT